MALTDRNLIQFANGDKRILLLTDWVKTVLGASIEFIEFASADASFRRYFRVGYRAKSYIVMDSPVNCDEFESFIRISIKFKQIGLSVPEIYAADHQNGFALMTDFGSTTYLDQLSPNTATQLYADAIDSLILLQDATFSDPVFLPPYSSELLLSEMELFRDWYLKENLQMEVCGEINAILDDVFSLLIDKAQEQPKVWVHRDYHSRNLMVLNEGNPGILDFQDAVYGPITYDLVSLLRDCYIVWDSETIECWLKRYMGRAQNSGLRIDCDETRFREWFDWMGLQRHIKVAGIFSRLNFRDGKSQYLADITRVMGYLQSVSKQYSKLRPLHELVVQLTSN